MRRGLPALLVGAYVTLLFCPPGFWQAAGSPRAALAWPRAALTRLVEVGLSTLGAPPTAPATQGAYLALAAIALPWLAMAALGSGRPAQIGLRVPNRLGWRLGGFGFAVALPFLFWMLAGPGFGEPYLRQREAAGSLGFAAFYLVNMASEHFLFHGVLLAALRAPRRWPPPSEVTAVSRSGLVGALQWLGLAQPTDGARGAERVRRWLGLPAGCLVPALLSGLLFGAVHLGKDPRELLLAAPGGFSLAVVAYRTNSCLVPFALHLATASSVWAILVARH